MYHKCKHQVAAKHHDTSQNDNTNSDAENSQSTMGEFKGLKKKEIAQRVSDFGDPASFSQACVEDELLFQECLTESYHLLI